MLFLQALEIEITEKQPVHESVTATSAKLAECCKDGDVDDLMARVDDMNKQWNEMNNEKSEKENALEKMASDLSEYEKRANTVEEKLKKTEKSLTPKSDLVMDISVMRSNLSNIKNCSEELNEIKPQLDETVEFGNNLLATEPDIDGSYVTRRNEQLKDLLEKTDKNVKDEESKMQELVDSMEQYTKSCKNLMEDLDYIHDEVEANKPGLLDVESLKDKDNNVKVKSW